MLVMGEKGIIEVVSLKRGWGWALKSFLFTESSLVVKIKCGYKIIQVFFILTTWELSVIRKDLPAPTLAGPRQLYKGS